MQTRALRTLVKVSQIGSFVRAAEQLGMTLSALSMQMKALEAELGATLFDRSVRPPRLTPIGRSVVAEAIPLLRREDALQEVCQPRDDIVGQFKIGFVTSAAVRLLPAFLRAARTAAPRARFEIETGLSAGLQDKVLSGQIDAAVLTDADGLPAPLWTRVLRREPFVFAAQEKLLTEGLDGLLARHVFFHFMPRTGIGTLIASAMAAQSRPPDAETIVLDNLEAIMECVAAGLGYTLLPVPDVDRYQAQDVQTRPGPPGLERRLVLAVLRDSLLARRAADLVGMLNAP
ncbi:MAG: LysR family transcriptional regulator [Pseudomonadota bacterium]